MIFRYQPDQPWPRKLVNYPIILIAVVQQYAIAAALVWDLRAHYATAVHILALVFPVIILPGILLFVSTLAVYGFTLKRKINTLLCVIPQQFLLYLSAGGAFEAIWKGYYADGTVVPQAHIFAEQILFILVPIFHTWAMILILRYGADEE